MPRLTLLLCLLLSPAARAESARFTTVYFDDEGVVYVGLKHGAPGISEVVSFPFLSGERTNIPLPADIAGRDVIGILPEKQDLFVLTAPIGQTSASPDEAKIASGDGPRLHVYDRDSGKWDAVGRVACPAFSNVTLKPNQMIFTCEIGRSRKGKAQTVRKAIALGRHRLYRGSGGRFPEFLLVYKGRTVVLEGLAPTWDRIRLRERDKSERTITAEELVHLPLLPAPTPLPSPVAPGTSSGTASEIR